jgi:hypothetical protein
MILHVERGSGCLKEQFSFAGRQGRWHLGVCFLVTDSNPLWDLQLLGALRDSLETTFAQRVQV